MSIRILTSISLLFLFACSGKNTLNTEITAPKDTLSEPFMKANKLISEKENALIEEFIKRKQWNMIKTGTGLRYGIYFSNNGVEIESGDIVELKYTLQLLDGTEVSKTEGNETESVVVDKDHVESGLHEALKYLHDGDKAKLVIPSHIAFGLTGDQDKIPAYSTLIYDIEIVDVRVN